MNDNLDTERERLDDWLAGAMGALSPSLRPKAAGKIARIRRGRHIANQQDSGGNPFKPRKWHAKTDQRAVRPIKFPVRSPPS